MMQSCASGDKLRDGGPILLRGCEPWCLSGQPPPRIANGTQSAEALRLATVDLPPVVDQLPLFSVLRWLCARRCPPASPPEWPTATRRSTACEPAPRLSACAHPCALVAIPLGQRTVALELE